LSCEVAQGFTAHWPKYVVLIKKLPLACSKLRFEK